MCIARVLNCFTMREARPHNRMTCTIISYALTLLPFIFVLVWIFDGMLGDGAGGDPAFLSKRGLAAHFGEEIVDPTTGAFSYPYKWKVFNWHPLLMTLGFVTLYTQAALHFRLLPFSHDTNKLIHFATQTLAMLVTTIAIAVIHRFKLHNYQGFEFYNPHGWIGITVYALFALQYVHGAYHFMLPKSVVSAADRKAYKPYHMWAGLWIYMGTAMAVVSGLAGYSWIFDGVEVPSTPPYRWAAVIALSTLVCAGVVAFHFMPTGLPPDSGNGQRGDMGQEALLGNGDAAGNGGAATGTPTGPSYRAMQPANAF